MSHSRRGLRAAGVAVGAVALVTSTTTAYACMPGDDAAAGARPAAQAATAEPAFAQPRLLAAHARELATLDAFVGSLQAKAAAVGRPKTLTPRQAARLASLITFANELRTWLGSIGSHPTLSAEQAAAVKDLDARLGALVDRLAAVLADATVVKPPATTPTTVRAKMAASHLVPAKSLADRHHCDGHSWYDGYTRDMRWSGHDGDGRYDGSRSWGDHRH